MSVHNRFLSRAAMLGAAVLLRLAAAGARRSRTAFRSPPAAPAASTTRSAAGMAQVLSKYIPGLSATAEVTGGSVDNLKLIGAGKSEVGFSMVDAAWDAYKGNDKFKDTPVAPGR